MDQQVFLCSKCDARYVVTALEVNAALRPNLCPYCGEVKPTRVLPENLDERQLRLQVAGVREA